MSTLTPLEKFLPTPRAVDQWSSSFWHNRTPAGTLLENRTLPIIFELSENSICFENNFSANEM